VRQPPLHLRRDLDDVDRYPAAGRARDELRSPMPQPEAFQDLPADANFLLRGPVSDTRNVSPIPSARRIPIPTDDLIVPRRSFPPP